MLRSRALVPVGGLLSLLSACSSQAADESGSVSSAAASGETSQTQLMPSSGAMPAATQGASTAASQQAPARSPGTQTTASAGANSAAPEQAASAPATSAAGASVAGAGAMQAETAGAVASAGAATGATATEMATASGTCAAMVAAANAFIETLDDAALKSAAVVSFDEHHSFAYEPQVAQRPGASLAMMTESQQAKALALVQTGLSEEGFKKAETVRALENLKGVTFFQVNMRDPTYYWLAIFGEPSETGEWGWQWEGHHLALHYTLKACAISDTPTFMGAWPSEVSTMATGAPAIGTRNLDQEEDLGRALAKSIDADPAKRTQAFQSAAYRQMLPEGTDNAQPMMPAGLAASAMSDSEKMQLRAIVTHYAQVMAPELAAARLERIEEHGGFDALSFVWTGALEPKQRHFYRVQGPSFFIEYRNDDGNHIHSAWRDFSGDFGDDLP